MPNYKETNIAGTKYTRSNRIILTNELDAAPSVHFAEQEVVVLGEGDKVVRPAQGVGTTLTPANVSTQFDLLHPETGAVVGSATYQEVYVLMHSLYYHLATERDNQG